jgi:tetratricopeptide (TPR) repeat protein
MARRRWQITAVVVGVVALVATVVFLFNRTPDAGPRPPAAPLVGGPGQDLKALIGYHERRARQLPEDWRNWAALGSACVQQARVSGDPSYYRRAETALNKSLEVRPDENAPALTGLGALAAARHDFAAALGYAGKATALAPYTAAGFGVTGDALIELGRYPEAFEAIQRMVDLQPDTGSYARASYAWELRGDTVRARDALEQALQVAPSAADAGFALYYLGELAYNAGDLATAADRYAEGLMRAPDYLPLRAGQARVAAAQGRTADAVAGYRAVVERLPQPGYVAELGDLLAATGDQAGAEQQYALVRATQKLLAGEGVATDLELALFDADHGAGEAALGAAQTAYPKRPGIFAADALAWALHANGRDAEALPHAREALRLGTRSAPLHYHLGMIEAALGQADAARRSLATALAINPYFSIRDAKQARDTLAKLGGAP